MTPVLATPAYGSKAKTHKTATSSSGKQPLKAVHGLGSHLPTTSTSSKIKFYNRDEPYYEFTNFYPCVVRIDGKDWPTTEHYFQAQKFIGTPYVEKVRKLQHPRDAFQLSRDPQVSRWRRTDWESVKDDVMLKALQVKFSKNSRLRKRLLDTGTRELIEHTSNDSYWGDGGNGTGQNKLGQFLMKVRRELRGTSPTVPSLQWSKDDSSLGTSRTQAAGLSRSQPSGRPGLRRSNSFSDVSHARSLSYGYPSSTASAPPSRPLHSSGGSHHHPTRPHPHKTTHSQHTSGHYVGNTVKTVAKKLKSGVSNSLQDVKSTVSDFKNGLQDTRSGRTSSYQSPTPRSSTPGKSNSSSVHYDIITGKKH